MDLDCWSNLINHPAPHPFLNVVTGDPCRTPFCLHSLSSLEMEGNPFARPFLWTAFGKSSFRGFRTWPTPNAGVASYLFKDFLTLCHFWMPWNRKARYWHKNLSKWLHRLMTNWWYSKVWYVSGYFGITQWDLQPWRWHDGWQDPFSSDVSKHCMTLLVFQKP